MSTPPPPGPGQPWEYGPPPSGDAFPRYPQQYGQYPYQGHPDPYRGYPDPHQGYPAQPPLAGDPLVATDLGGWFSRVFGVMRRSFGRLLVLQGVAMVVIGAAEIVIVQNMLSAMMNSVATIQAAGRYGRGGDSSLLGPMLSAELAGFLTPTTLLLYALMLAISVLVQAASWWVVISDAAGQPTSLSAALRFGVRRFLPLLGWGLVANLLATVGYIFLLVPGVYLSIVFVSTLLGVVIVERGGIGRCFALIKGRFWATTGRLLLAGALGMGYLILLSVLITPVSLAFMGSGSNPFSGLWVSMGLNLVLAIPAVVAYLAVLVVTYVELRGHERPGVSTATLAAELAR